MEVLIYCVVVIAFRCVSDQKAGERDKVCEHWELQSMAARFICHGVGNSFLLILVLT